MQRQKYCLYYLHVRVLHIVYVRSFFKKKSSQKAHLKLISNIPLIQTADLHVFKEIKGLKGGETNLTAHPIITRTAISLMYSVLVTCAWQ